MTQCVYANGAVIQCGDDVRLVFTNARNQVTIADLAAPVVVGDIAMTMKFARGLRDMLNEHIKDDPKVLQS